MKKLAFSIMILTFLSKIVGFGRDIALSYLYGTTYISDAYLISLTIPSVVFGFIGAGITTAYIPMFSRIKTEKSKREADVFTSNFTNIILLITTIIILISAIFTENIVRIFAIGFTSETFIMAVNFTRISLISMYITAILSIYTGYLQIHGFYYTTILIGLPLNLITILSYFISTKYGYIWLPIGTVLAMTSQVVLMFPKIKKTFGSYTLKFDFKDPYLKEILFIAVPVILGISTNQINVLVDRTIASNIAIDLYLKLTHH